MRVHEAAAAILLATFALGACSQSQTQSQVSSGKGGWSDVAKWPDFMGGTWGDGLGAGGPDVGPNSPKPPLTPEAAAAAEKIHAATAAAGGSPGCLPPGLPVAVGGQFFYTKGAIFLMANLDMYTVREIFMDGREHGDPDPSYYGHSIGHWEGDTLVVDTVGFLPEVPIASGVPGDGKTHVVERFRLTAPDTMEYIQIIDNPEKLTETWTIDRTLKLHRDWQVQETYCQQNDREAPVGGEAHLDLTAPK